MSDNKLSVIILTHNDEETVVATLKSVDFADEILVIDDNSTDATLELCRSHQVKVVSFSNNSFAIKRNHGLSHAQHSWVLYVDSDEVVEENLQEDVLKVIDRGEPGIFFVKRKNILLGISMYEDKLERLFHKSLLNEWYGELHETPKYLGNAKILTGHLLHFSHRDISSMLTKTNQWSETEVDLRIKSNHPPVAWWRLVRITITTAWAEFIRKHLLTFGRSGLFEGYFQIIDKLIVYTKLWERQQTITIKQLKK